MIKFLTLKNWQLFGLLVGLPMIFPFFAIVIYISKPSTFILAGMIPVIMLLVMGCFLSWFYALGTNLHKKLPVTAKMSLTRFKIFLFIPIGYILLFCAFMLTMFYNVSNGVSPNPAIFSLIVPFHLFSMFCIFYCLYFNAKALKSVELQRPVSFSDFAGEFFLIWFFPIGVWIIQPRINKLFDGNMDQADSRILDMNI
jgi:hypothetical protein